MTAVVRHARASLRRRWRAVALLLVLGSLAGGSVLALAAGARRADTAFPRFLRSTHAPDAYVFAPQSQLSESTLRRLPGVRDVAELTALPQPGSDLSALALTDPRWGRDMNGFKVLAGRRLDPRHPYEAMVGFLMARQLHLHPGSTLTIHVGGPQRLRVVGIEAAAGEFPPRTSSSNLAFYVAPAFLQTPAVRAVDPPGGDDFHELGVRLAPGTSVAALSTEVERAAHGFVSVEAQHDQAADVERSEHAQAVVVRVVAGIAAATAVLVMAQLLLRDSPDDAQERATLRAVGFTRRELVRAELLRVALLAVGTAVGSAVVALAISPLFPLGTARTAEPSPGFAADATVLLLGAVAVLAVVALLGASAAARVVTRAPSGPARRSRLAGILGLAGFPLVVDLGVRQAVDGGRGARATPVRATLVTATAGVVAIAGLVTVSASIHHLRGTPTLYGVIYDAQVTSNAINGDVTPIAAALGRDPAVRDVVVASTGVPFGSGSVRFGGEAVIRGLDRFEPTVVEGRLPQTDDEIVLGSRTMHQLHTAVGRTVHLSVVGITGPVAFRVVGRGVMAPLSDSEGLGQGALLGPEAVARLVTFAPKGFTAPPPSDAFIRLRGPATPAALAAVQARLAPTFDTTIEPRAEPADVATFGELQELPWLVTILLSVLAVLAVLHLLSSSVRRRRRDLGVLQVLGVRPRQLGLVVGWQGVAVSAVALAIGVPLGIAAGRVTWMLLSSWVGLVPRPTVSLALTTTLVPVALVLALLAAVGPARAAARTRPVEVLRTDS